MSKLEISTARQMYPQTYKVFDELRVFVSKKTGLDLPDVMLDLHTTRAGANGWFRNRSQNDNWTCLSGGDILEIGINPAGQTIESAVQAKNLETEGWTVCPTDDDKFIAHRPTHEVISTLLHEVCHLADHVANETKRTDHHGEYWQQLMTMVGLEPINCEPEKKRSNKWTHRIIPGGEFEAWLAKSKTLQAGFEMDWRKNPKRAKAASKSTVSVFECPVCGASLRGAVKEIEQMPICGNCSSAAGHLIYYVEKTADGTIIDRNRKAA